MLQKATSWWRETNLTTKAAYALFAIFLGGFGLAALVFFLAVGYLVVLAVDGPILGGIQKVGEKDCPVIWRQLIEEILPNGEKRQEVYRIKFKCEGVSEVQIDNEWLFCENGNSSKNCILATQFKKLQLGDAFVCTKEKITSRFGLQKDYVFTRSDCSLKK